MRAHDPIPILPPMPRPVRHRRRSYGRWIGLIAVATALALSAIALAVRARARDIRDGAFQRAEELFQSGAFATAQSEFEFFASQYADDPRAAQAQLAAEMSRTAQSLDDDLADTERTIAALDRLHQDYSDASSFAERWSVLQTMAQRSARTRLTRAADSLDPDSLAAGSRWLDWLRRQQAGSASDSAIAELDDLRRRAIESLARQSRRRAVLESVDLAVDHGGADRFADAFQQYEAWRGQSDGDDDAVARAYERLQSALRAQVQFQASPAAETPAQVPRLPLEPYTRLSTRRRHAPGATHESATLFIRAKDLCFGIDAASGAIRWVLRVGYDAAVPERVPWGDRTGALVPWYQGSEPMLSLCDAATGDAIWSWRGTEELSGAPLVTRDAVFVATRAGVVWQLDLQTGAARGTLELPEPIDSPLALREDSGGVCVIGARHALYLLDVAREQPQCTDAVVIGRRGDTARCQALWVGPYLVFFENDLVDRCHVRVLHRGPDGYRTVRQIDLEGRVWQPPVLDGADIFVVTDRSRAYCFGLDVGNPAVNLFTAATTPKPGEVNRTASRAYAARVGDVPFVVLDEVIAGLRVDRSPALPLVREMWRRALPSQSAGVQPLQVAGRIVAAVLQEPRGDGVAVLAIDSVRGELLWETRLADSVSHLAVAGVDRPAAPFVAGSRAGGLFGFSPDAGGGTTRHDLPAAASMARYSDRLGRFVYASDSGTSLRSVSAADWKEFEAIAAAPPVASSLALAEGRLAVGGASPHTLDAGTFAIWVSRERSFELREVSGSAREIHGVRLPAVPIAAESGAWHPLAVQSPEPAGGEVVIEGFVAWHPSGILCRLEVSETEGIKHVVVRGYRSDLPALAAPPALASGAVLCAAADGLCFLLDPRTLRTVSEWRAAGPITDCAIGSERMFVVSDGRQVQALQWSDDLKSIWSRDWGEGAWRIEYQPRGGGWSLVSYDAAGRIELLDDSTGATTWTHEAVAPLALPPRWRDAHLVFATTDGGLFELPVPR